MKNSILLSTIFSTLCLFSFNTQANDKVEHVYDAQKYQQVCKGKKEGDAVSFAFRGIIWNGSCQPQFLPAGKTANLKGDEKELNSICRSDTTAKSVNIEGKEYKGKCGLGFVPPTPRS